MTDQFIEIEGKVYEITEKEDMYTITIKSSFIGYLTKEGEYLGKSLAEDIVSKIKKAILNS